MRSKKAQVRNIQPDAKYNSVKVTRLINYIMYDGKKSVAQKQIYIALDQISQQHGRPALDILEDVLRNISPQMEVRSRRVGGAAYQVPMPVKGRRGSSLSLRWLTTEANKRPSKQYRSFAEKLVAEMNDALNNQGGAIQKKEGAHKMAEANKAFAHFRW